MPEFSENGNDLMTVAEIDLLRRRRFAQGIRYATVLVLNISHGFWCPSSEYPFRTKALSWPLCYQPTSGGRTRHLD